MEFGQFTFFLVLVIRWALPIVLVLLAVGWALRLRRRIDQIAQDVKNLSLQLDALRPRPPA